MRKTLIAAVLVLGTSTACGGLTGEVVAKEYQPGYPTIENRNVYRQDCRTITRPYTSTSYNGKTSRSTTSYRTTRECSQVWAGVQPYTVWHPACSRITVRRSDGGLESACVSDRRYESAQIGQQAEGW